MERLAPQDGDVASVGGRETDQTDANSTEAPGTPNVDSLQVCRALTKPMAFIGSAIRLPK